MVLLEHAKHIATKRIVLASQSPRRRELLTTLGITHFEVITSTFDELLDKSSFPSGAEYAVATARHKALEVAARCPSADLVIAADTVVEQGGRILEKPLDGEDAFRVLRSLAGNKHQVHTGVVLVLPKQPEGSKRLREFSQTTDVEFAPLSDATIRAYVATGEPMDKAGSYGIQGTAGSFVKGIQGCYFNVMGLPMYGLSEAVASLVDEGLL